MPSNTTYSAVTERKSLKANNVCEVKNLNPVENLAGEGT
jgi:hypothetical protein